MTSSARWQEEPPPQMARSQEKAEEWLRQVVGGRWPTAFDTIVSAPILVDLIDRLRGAANDRTL